MPTCTLLGATGATGSAVLRYLLTSGHSDNKIRIFVRSESKLHAAFPQLLNNPPCDVRIFSGQLTDHQALSDCLEDVDIIYNCIATNVSTRGVDVTRSAAEAVLSALGQQQQKKEESYNSPVILINRSQSLNPALPGGFAEKMAHFALANIYADIEAAGELYKAAANQSPPLLTYIFVDPPSLHDPDRTERTGHELVKEGSMTPSLNYADLGAAFVEAAQRRSEFEGGGVGVKATGQVRETPGILMGYVWEGLKSRLLPF